MEKKRSSLMVGGIALVFLVLGYQVAVFVHKASVTRIMSHRDRPDTVYVVDEALARKLLEDSPGPVPGDRPSAKPAVRRQDVSRGSGSLLVRRESAHPEAVRELRRVHTSRRYESFRFNPNTVSEEDLQRLGFSPKQAQSIIRYREKGGRFRRKSDFARSFVVADSVYQRLEPYIDIPLVDLNTADSAAFDALPGIGPWFAAKMVEYRSRLGGYSYKEQLMDIWHFDREKYEGLADLVTVRKKTCTPYPLWRLGADSLALHPYIGRYAARGVILYREHNPREALTVEGLIAAGVLKPELGPKLARCLIEAP